MLTPIVPTIMVKGSWDSCPCFHKYSYPKVERILTNPPLPPLSKQSGLNASPLTQWSAGFVSSFLPSSVAPSEFASMPDGVLRRSQKFLQLDSGVHGQLACVVLAHERSRFVIFALQGLEDVQSGGQEAVRPSVAQHQRFVREVMRVHAPQQCLGVVRVTLSRNYYLVGEFGTNHQGLTNITILAWPSGNLPCTLVLLARSYFEQDQSSVNSPTRHENFQPRLPVGQVTAEICLPNRKSAGLRLSDTTLSSPESRFSGIYLINLHCCFHCAEYVCLPSHPPNGELKHLKHNLTPLIPRSKRYILPTF